MNHKFVISGLVKDIREMSASSVGHMSALLTGKLKSDTGRLQREPRESVNTLINMFATMKNCRVTGPVHIDSPQRKVEIGEFELINRKFTGKDRNGILKFPETPEGAERGPNSYATLFFCFPSTPSVSAADAIIAALPRSLAHAQSMKLEITA